MHSGKKQGNYHSSSEIKTEIWRTKSKHATLSTDNKLRGPDTLVKLAPFTYISFSIAIENQRVANRQRTQDVSHLFVRSILAGSAKFWLVLLSEIQLHRTFTSAYN